MDVIVNYIDGSTKEYFNCDDIDVDEDYIDIYTDPSEDEEPCIGLDLNLVKSVYTVSNTPAGNVTDRVYFNKKFNSKKKKEVSNMNTTEEAKALKAAEATAEAEAAEAAAVTSEDDDFDFAETFNRKGRLFTIDTEGMEGHKASEVFADIGSEPLIMKAVFINKDTGLGESVSVVTPNGIIYFGKSNLEAARNIRDNEKAVAKLNSTGALFKITEFEAKKFKKKGYAFQFLTKSEIPAELADFMKTGEISSDVPEDAALFKW